MTLARQLLPLICQRSLSIINVAQRKACHLIGVNARGYVGIDRRFRVRCRSRARGIRLIPDTAGAVCAGQGIACRLIDAGLLAASFGRGGVNRRSIIRRPRVRRGQRPMHN